MFNVVTSASVKFTLGKEIGGEGKNSNTYLAHDDQLGADIVVKKVSKASLRDPVEYYKESRALYASAHPNVVQVHYACEDGSDIFIAMPHYKKGSIRALLKTRYLTSREVAALGCQILSGLHNIHSKGLVHFDIKSDNVLLSDRQEALITDFGLCKQLANGLASPDGIYGPHVPPEALSNTAFGPAYDIYQTGLTLYAMAGGVSELSAQFDAYVVNGAFDEARFKADLLGGRYPDRSALPPHIPAKLKKVIKRCLEVTPADRFSSALDAMNALASVDGNELDWQFSRSGTDLVWTKAADNVTFLFTVSSSGASSLTKAIGTGPARKVTAGFHQKITPQQIASVLKTH